MDVLYRDDGDQMESYFTYCTIYLSEFHAK